ncbi:MAG: TIGR01777 family oxidoreductase [Flavobacteriaceae bacterium]|nr:TIGR01777 family oxidoreductase [Flavobacteriaceae bacterium]
MKFLISGATGLVGKILIEHALKEGHEVHFLTRSKSKLGFHKGIKGFYWNPEEGLIDSECLNGVDTIIHLAGATVSKPWTKKYKNEILTSRINTTSLLVKTLEGINHTVSSVVSASAIGVYPSSPDKIHNEEDPVSSGSFMEQVVIDWEKAVDEFQALNIKVSKLRIGLVLATQGGVLATLKIPTQFGLGAAFGTGQQWQSWIHVSDLARLFLTAANNKWEGVYNAVAPEVVSQTEFIRQLAQRIRRPFFMPPLPKFLIRLMVGEMSTLVLNSHFVSSEKVKKENFTYNFPTLEKALKDLL